ISTLSLHDALPIYSKKNGTMITGRTPAMSNSALRKARDLSSDVRDALERLLGRALQEEETISVQTYPTHEAPTGSERDEAWRRLLERIDKTAARVAKDRKSTRLNSSHDQISYAVFCLKKK